MQSVVYFPDGDYVIPGVLFAHQTAHSPALRGQSRDGVRLRFAKPLITGYGINHQPGDLPGAERSRWLWPGGLIWFTPQPRNTFRKTVDPHFGFNDSGTIGP